MPRVFVLSGSARSGSFNTALLNVAVSELEAAGADVSRFDFRATPLPVFDADLEAEGYPDSVIAIKRLVRESNAVLMAGPEYNAGPTPLLKNAIDWVSRAKHDQSNEWDGKVVGLMSASPSAFGGVRAQFVYRNALVHCRAFVLPGTVSVPNAGDAFDESGNLKNERALENLRGLVTELMRVSSRLH